MDTADFAAHVDEIAIVGRRASRGNNTCVEHEAAVLASHLDPQEVKTFATANFSAFPASAHFKSLDTHNIMFIPER